MGYTHLFNNYLDPVVASESTVPSVTETNGGGFQLGGYYSFTPMDDFFLQAELLLSNRMWNEITTSTYEGQVTTVNQEYIHYSNNYLEIPLSAKYGINMRRTRYGGNKYLFFYGGPSFHLMMSTKGSIQETSRVDAQEQTTVVQNERDFTKSELKSHFSPMQAGVFAGIQFNFEFGLNVDLRYQYLMMPVTKNDPTQDGLKNPTLKQGMASLTIGYSFLRD